MRYELWESEDGELTLSPEGVPPPAPLDADATPLHVFEADTWERAMAQYHDHMGWGPYRPV
ncbi:hypothetical protein [Stackebrandtia soli]|uniref:hypothetical protein n=1 Tax=Stackebrandtia soli TaxID=1892856 RepID=UPI0039EC1602